MTNSIEDVTTQAKAYFVIGSNTTEQHPVIGMRIRQAVKQRGVKLIVADPRDIPLADFAVLHLRQHPGTDIALLNGIMNVLINEDLYDKEFVSQRTENFEELKAVVMKYPPEVASQITGVPAADIIKAAHILAANKPGALLYAMGITQHRTGTHNVMSCGNLQMLLGNMGVPGGGVNPLRGQNNVQGACDMGGLPNVYSGYQQVAVDDVRKKFEAAWGVPLSPKPGLTVVEMLNGAEHGQVRAIYCMGENPVLTDPDSNHVRRCLTSLDLLVVQDIFLSETAALADVVLPVASFVEKDGTFTNTERRVQLVRRAIPTPGQALADWEVIMALAQRLLGLRTSGDSDGRPEGSHAGWDYLSPADIMDEIAALTPSYGGIHHWRLQKVGLQWPCPNDSHAGTPILHVGKFTRGLGRFSGVEHVPPAELPDAEYPLTLTTGRELWHYHTGSMTRRSKGLNAQSPEGFVEINPEDAQPIAIHDGDWVQVVSRRGEVKTKARITEDVPPGVVFMTFHFAEAPANALTISVLDPIAKIPEFKACAVALKPATNGHGNGTH
jgi:formate dehydrogenase major subunit/formate dehydrogenase alpha subunit